MRLIVFDYDGTLVDSQAMIVATMQGAFAELGHAAPEPAAVRGVIGLALERAILHLALPPGAAAGEPELTLVASLAATYRRRVVAERAKHGVGQEPLFHGMREAVMALERSDRLLAIATGKNRRGLVHGLAGHGLARHFAILKTADDGPSKPHPAILQQAMAEAGARPEETLMIGDTAFDMEMARQAGAHALGVAWGYHAADELLAAGARQVAPRPADLPALVEAFGVRKLKLILVGLLALAVALLVTGYVIIANYPVEELKALIQDEVRAATGRELEIRGGAEMRVSFTPSVVLEDVHFRNPDWASSPDLAAMRRFEVEVEAWPLIKGDVVIRRLVLIEPVIELERGADGTASWDLAGGEPPAAGREPGTLPLVQALAIERGTVVLRSDAAAPRTLLLERLEASAAEADGAIALAVRGTLDGSAFDLTFALASLTQITSGLPFPITLSGQVAGARLGVAGQFGSLADGGSDLRVTLAGDDLAALSPLLGSPLPALGPYALEVHVNQPAPTNLQIPILKATLGGSDLSGTLAIQLDGAVPRVNGTLAARRLALEDLSPAETAQGGDGRLFPDRPLPLELLALLDASLTLSVGELLLADGSLTNLQAALQLEEQRLVLKPLSFGYAGGSLLGEASLDAAQEPPVATLLFNGSGLDLAQLSGGEATGTLGLALDLEGRGASPRALAASLGGRSELSAGAGVIHNRALALASGSLVDLLKPLFGGGDQVQMTCFVSRFAWKGGLGTSQGSALDTSAFTLVGNGTLDLRDETIDVYVDSASKGGLVGLAVPFTVSGSLAAPAIAPDPAGTALGLAKTAGLVVFPPAGLAAIIGDQQRTQTANPCVAAVQEVEEKGGPAGFFEDLGKAAGDAVDSIIEGGKDAGDAIGEGLQDATDGIKQLFGN